MSSGEGEEIGVNGVHAEALNHPQCHAQNRNTVARQCRTTGLTFTTVADPLEQLRDIHLPEPVSWWPPAPGWWILAILFLGLIAACSLWYRSPSLRAYRQARKELSNLREQHKVFQDDVTLVTELSVLLRRYALAVFGRKRVASLIGDVWMTFLNKKGKTVGFTEGAGKVLLTVPYGGRDQVEAHALLSLVEQWMKTNRRWRT